MRSEKGKRWRPYRKVWESGKHNSDHPLWLVWWGLPQAVVFASGIWASFFRDPTPLLCSCKQHGPPSSVVLIERRVAFQHWSRIKTTRILYMEQRQVKNFYFSIALILASHSLTKFNVFDECITFNWNLSKVKVECEMTPIGECIKLYLAWTWLS